MTAFARETVCAIALVLLLTGCVSTPRDLTKPCSWRESGGRPVAVAASEGALPIFVADTPANRVAADFLAVTIEEICGRRPDVCVIPSGREMPAQEGLFVGGDPEVDCGEEGFRVIAADGRVRFLGRADYAVYDWCERALGVRYYCADGKCVEPREEIAVPAVDYWDRPVYEHREFGRRQAPWVRFAKAGSAHRGGVHVHAPHGWFRDAKLKAEHPGIFESGLTPMLCYGNPETLDYYKLRIDRHIAGLEDSGGIVNTNRKVVTVSPWDAPIACECEHCRGLYDMAYGTNGYASPIVWGSFLTRLARWLKTAHPDYMVSFLPYLNTCEVPSPSCRVPRVRRSWRGVEVKVGRSGRTLRLDGDCEAEVCTMPGLALLKNDACKVREERILREWQAATGRKVLSWHYGCWPLEWTSAPYVFGETIQRHCADMRSVSCGTFVCGGGDDPRMALSMYVWAKCLWNPDLDVGAVYDEFARRMFGAGADDMRALIALQERCWNRQWADDECSFRNVFEVSFPPEDVGRMKSLLKAAYAKVAAAGDKSAVRRVRQYAAGLTQFFLDEAQARKTRACGVRLVRPGETNEMIVAQHATSAPPWAKTCVSFEPAAEGKVRFTVRCEEPAAAKMTFGKMAPDFVRGNDNVKFVIDDGEGVKTAKAFADGHCERALFPGFAARVTHDATGWTVEATIPVGAKARARGELLGNVCRWRVGDRRLPESERVKGSRYEHSRLATLFTNLDDDPAAFVKFDIIHGK